MRADMRSKNDTFNGSRRTYCTDCPAGFTYFPTMIGGCYKVVSENLNWTDAGLRCRTLHVDAHLLIINDAAEQFFIAGMLSAVDCKCQLFYVL